MLYDFVFIGAPSFDARMMCFRKGKQTSTADPQTQQSLAVQKFHISHGFKEVVGISLRKLPELALELCDLG